MEALMQVLADNIEGVVGILFSVIVGLLGMLAKKTKTKLDDGIYEFMLSKEDEIEKEVVKRTKKVLTNEIAKAKAKKKNQ